MWKMGVVLGCLVSRLEKGQDRSPVFWFLRFKDRKKTSLDEPVASVRTGLL